MVSEGRKVSFQVPGDDPEWGGDAGWILQGWAVTLAAVQRGHLSLHAATVDIDGQLIAVAGDRGAGKSTTAMGLRNRNHALLVDDVTLIEFRDHEAWTTPYARNVHLLPDAAHALGIDFNSLPLLSGGRDKAAFTPAPPDSEPRRIDAIVVLVPDPEAGQLSVTEARGAERVRELKGHTERDGIAPIVLGEEAYFRALTLLATSCPVFVVRRPTSGWTLDDVLDTIERLARGLATGANHA
jgi:hypothetical protein